MEITVRLSNALAKIDAYNKQDPTTEEFNGEQYPKELLYAIRMYEFMEMYLQEPDEYCLLAARAQHIGRWEIARDTYPMDKPGYYKWRNELKKHHVAVTNKILQTCHYTEPEIEEVTMAISKQDLKNNERAQAVEDVACLVFLEYYALEFASKNNDKNIPEILGKVLRKMSDKGKEAILHLQNKQVVAIVKEILT